MKKLIILLILSGGIFSTTLSQELSYDVGGLSKGQSIISAEFMTPEHSGAALVINLGIFPIPEYDADISAGIDGKLYSNYQYISKSVYARFGGTVGAITSLDYNEDKFYYGLWFKTGVSYKLYLYSFNWFAKYMTIEPGLDIYVGTSDIIPALSNVVTAGYPAFKINIGVGL